MAGGASRVLDEEAALLHSDASPQKQGAFSELAGEIIRAEALVQPFENVLNEGRAPNGDEKPKGPGDVGHRTRVRSIDIRDAHRRLAWRHAWIQRRQRSTIVSLVLALIGLVLMIFLNECTFSFIEIGQWGTSSYVAHALRCLIVISTLALLASIVFYHVSDLQILSSETGISDWRVAITWQRVVQVTVELLVCAICPVPFKVHFSWWTMHSNGVTVTKAWVPVDILLSIPMFLRFYLVSRVLLFCMPQFTKTSTKLVAHLNRITFSLGFVVKTLVTFYPGITLLVFATTYVMSASYVTRLCERYHYLDEKGDPIPEPQRFTDYLNNVWYIIITFLTIGYGDIVVNTYCGRAVAVLTGLVCKSEIFFNILFTFWGVALTALIVNVVGAQIKLSDADTRLFDFVYSHHLYYELRHSAADLIRNTWLIHKLRKHDKAKDVLRLPHGHALRGAQRKFVKARRRFRNARTVLATYPELQEIASEATEDVADEKHRIAELSKQVTELQASVNECNVQLKGIANTLRGSTQ